MTVKVTKRRNILTNQNESITDKDNTTLQFKSFINYKNRHIKSYYRNSIITKK